jgi:hypothetical protein
MENLESLLNSVNAILREEKIKKEESLRRGERFNMFQICGVDHYEVMHSAIIASFLDPKGNHGQKDKYLKAFLRIVDDKTEIETSSCSIYTEYVTNEGRIDILIEDKGSKGIIIENKVYASDQSEQLKRYDKFSKEKYKVGNYAIYYLTLDEHDASDDSGKGINYTSISYKEHILNWIGECIKESATTPLIRETLIQYSSHIKQLTNQDMDTENKKKMLDILKRNLSDAVNILGFENEIKKEVRRKYINTVLAKIAKRNGFELDENIEDFVNIKNDAIISFKDTHDPKISSLCGNFVIKWLGGTSKSIFYGIMTSNPEVSKVEKIWPEVNNAFFPYGFKWLANSGPNCYWDRIPAIIQMQKEIEMTGDEYPDDSIAKEIDDQLKLINENLVK